MKRIARHSRPDWRVARLDRECAGVTIVIDSDRAIDRSSRRMRTRLNSARFARGCVRGQGRISRISTVNLGPRAAGRDAAERGSPWRARRERGRRKKVAGTFARDAAGTEGSRVVKPVRFYDRLLPSSERAHPRARAERAISAPRAKRRVSHREILAREYEIGEFREGHRVSRLCFPREF
jgi:hypothetical protein